MAIPNPNPNIADGIKSDNKTYSSNKIESLIKTATELPIPEAGDAGKVLTVNSDSDGYELDNVGGIPSIGSGDAGKVITVNAGETAYELATPVAPESIIDDSEAAADTVYSSSKVDTLLSDKASASDLTTLSGLVSAMNIESVTRVAATATTGASGNIALPYNNDGFTYIVGAMCTTSSYVPVVWVSSTNNTWYMTIRGSDTWSTANNQEVNIRYLVVKIKNI